MSQPVVGSIVMGKGVEMYFTRFVGLEVNFGGLFHCMPINKKKI